MQTNIPKHEGPQIPRSELRTSAPVLGRRLQLRPSSATLAEKNPVRSIFGKFRSNSARARPEDLVEQVPDEPEEPAMQHKEGCPRLKARSRSRYGGGVIESSSGMMHPKPWGARDLAEIPCFCRTSRDSKESFLSQLNRRPFKQNDARPLSKSSKAKIADIVDNFGSFLERRKFRIAENELGFLMKKLEERIQKFSDKPNKTSQPKQEQKEPVKKQKNIHAIIQRQQSSMPQKSLSREHMMELQKSKLPGTGQSNILGKVETKKYYLGLTPEDQVPNNFRNILGNMNTAIMPQTEMFLAMDDKQPAILSLPDDLRHYSVKAIDMDNYTGLQLHHQAENTTLLLASNPTLARRNIHAPVQAIIQKPQMSPLGFKQTRRT